MPERAGSWEAPSTPTLRSLNTSPWSFYVWGSNEAFQISCDNSALSTPVLAPIVQGKNIAFIASSQSHTAYVAADGEIFMSGRNDSAQLASQPKLATDGGQCYICEPTRASALEAHMIDAVACGNAFTVAVTQAGDMIGWGAGSMGQLGPPPVEKQVVPRRIKGLDGVRMERVATGVAHTMALSQHYQVYSFGAGAHGVLGHGHTDNRDKPALVQKLWGAGIIAIDAGDYQSVALAADGRVWTWGRGAHGALGLGSTDDAVHPEPVKTLARRPIAAIAAGGGHMVALSVRRRIYTWGCNSSGQLGLGHQDDGLIPVVLADSESWGIAQISAGAEHTLLLSSRGELYGTGASQHGQLASLGPGPHLLPAPLALPHQCKAAAAIACGNHCIAACGAPATITQAPRPPVFLTCNSPMPISDPLALAKAARPDSSDAEERQKRIRSLIQAIRGIFGSPGLLLAGFSVPAPPALDGSGDLTAHRLDIDAISEVFEAMLLVLESDVVVVLRETIIGLLNLIEEKELADFAEGSASAMSQAQWVKVLLIFLLNPINSDARAGAHLLPAALAKVAFLLKFKARKLLTTWLSQLPPDVLGGRALRPLQRHLTSYVEALGWTKSRSHVLLVGSLVHILDDANKLAGSPVPYTKFHNAAVSSAVMQSLQVEWMAWQHVKRGLVQYGLLEPMPQSLCQLPFLMTPECKKVIMQGEAMLMQNHEVQNSLDRAMMLMQQGAMLIGPHISQIGRLSLTVRRSHILEDAMQQIQLHMDDLHKPLKVMFLGGEKGDIQEEAIDEGGVSKEFFQLLVRDIFLPDFGMFEYTEETREYWFSPAALSMGASPLDFKMVGIVLGLGIFNAVILDVRLPLVVYKKLLNGTPTFADLEDAQPALAKGLKAMLEYDGDDFQDVFSQMFEVEFRVFDSVQRHELMPGGSERPVTQRNKKEFVDLMVDWYLSKSIETLFNAFKAGFYSVASGSSLVLFNHFELELLVCGLPHLDFHAFEKAAVYEGGYTAEHPAVKQFWALLHSLSLEEKKRFLMFVTGSDRAPMGGLGQLRMLIQRASGDTDRLPTSHTCFNVLLLPEYVSEDKMRRMVLTAIDNAQGFGLQ